MRRSTKTVLAIWALLVALACLYVPWVSPDTQFVEAGFPSMEVFEGYGWFWQGPNIGFSPDYVTAARNHWKAHELSYEQVQQLRSAIVSDPAFHQNEAVAVAHFIDVLVPTGPRGPDFRPPDVPADLIKSADDNGLETVLLAIADSNQVVSWLSTKRNFDRTFPDKQNLSHEQQIALLYDMQGYWKRARLSMFARIKYPYLGLEILALSVLAGAVLVLLQSRPSATAKRVTSQSHSNLRVN